MSLLKEIDYGHVGGITKIVRHLENFASFNKQTYHDPEELLQLNKHAIKTSQSAILMVEGEFNINIYDNETVKLLKEAADRGVEVELMSKEPIDKRNHSLLQLIESRKVLYVNLDKYIFTHFSIFDYQLTRKEYPHSSAYDSSRLGYFVRGNMVALQEYTIFERIRNRAGVPPHTPGVNKEIQSAT